MTNKVLSLLLIVASFFQIAHAAGGNNPPPPTPPPPGAPIDNSVYVLFIAGIVLVVYFAKYKLKKA